MRRCEWIDQHSNASNANCGGGSDTTCVSSGVGVDMGGGTPYFCGKDLYGHEYTPYPGMTAEGYTCPRNSLCVVGTNENDGWTAFDNIAIASFTLFQMMTLEGWSDLMYAAQGSESSFAGYYFVVVILLFGFIVVNLYIAVIVQTFAKIRRRNDERDRLATIEKVERKATEAHALREKAKRNAGVQNTTNPLASPGGTVGIEMDVIYDGRVPNKGINESDKVKQLLSSISLEQYQEGIMTLVDSVDEIWLLTQEDLASIGMKLVHIRRLMETTKAPPAFHDELALAAVESTEKPTVHLPQGLTPAEEMKAFLRAYKLEQYHSKLVKLVDNLTELSKLSQADFEYAGLKLHHARELKQHLIDWGISMPQEGEETLNSNLIKILGGESVGMWRARIMRNSCFWQSGFGRGLLYMWYRQDPVVDHEDPPPPAERTKFVEPYEWSNPAGKILASTPWEVFISTCIMVNTMTMSMGYYGMSDEYARMLMDFEIIFFFIFFGEMQLKFIGMGGLMWYFSEPFNQFDFVLVTSSIPTVIANIAGTEPFINLSMLRVLKMLRMLRLLRKTRQLIMVVAKASKPMGNLLLFIIFTLSLFSIFGMQMFAGQVCEGDLVDSDQIVLGGQICPDDELPRTNMDTFFNALFALFQVMTGEDWNALMYNILRPNTFQSVVFGMIFMVIFFVLANYVLMEMFVAVILENFQLQTQEKFELQTQLLETKRAKAKAAKELAEGVDKALAAQKAVENKSKEDEARRTREQKIRERNEAKRLGQPIPEDEPPPQKTPEELERERKLKEMREADLREQVRAEMKAKQSDIEIPEGGDGYDEEMPGNTNKLILDAVEEGPKVKIKKEVKVEVVVELTCFCLATDNDFREFCYNLEKHWMFDTTMFLTICVSSVMIALDTPYKIDPSVRQVVTIADPIILGIFTLEFVIRIISRGFSGKPSAYISDDWNKLDFFVLCFSYLCVLISDIPGAIARSIRVGRAIRPLRMINQNERIQIVFNALFMAAPDIANVMFLGFFIMFMFAVMGLGFFMGRFYSCNNEDVGGKSDCLNIFETETESGDTLMVPSVWSNPNWSFDNVFAGLLTLFEVSSLEGWLDVMYSCQDMVGVDRQPVKDNTGIMFWYIVMYIAAVPFFLLNLVVGVIIEKFNQISGRGLLTQEQRMFKDTLLQAMLHDGARPLERPQGAIAGTCYAIVTNESFESVVLMLVVLNSILMATTHYGQPESYAAMLTMMNLVFTVLFAIEMVLKLIGLGFKYYFNDGWNCLDFVVVVGSIIMIPLDGILNLQALRPFRLLVIFRMIRRARGIRLMVSTLLLSLPSLFNVTCLLALAFFIFAVLGMSIFGNVKYGENLNHNANFHYFDNSLLTLSRMVTGEAWNGIMHDCMIEPPDCTDWYGAGFNTWGDLTEEKADSLSGYWLPNDCGTNSGALLFFVCFQIVGNYMVLNLFVAVILDNYAFMANVGDAELNEFVLEKFKKTWYRFTLKDRHADRHLGQALKVNKLKEFLEALGAPLGVVVWDYRGDNKFKMIREEVRRVEVPNVGISYRQMQYILCVHAMSEDPACDMPVEEKVMREEFLTELATERAASLIQAIYRGKKGRRALGVATPRASGNAAESQAAAFKKRFVGLMNDPNKMQQRQTQAIAGKPPSTLAIAGMPQGATGHPPQPGAANSAGVPPMQQGGSPSAAVGQKGLHAGSGATPAEEDATSEVRNVFRERAKARAAAKAKGAPS